MIVDRNSLPNYTRLPGQIVPLKPLIFNNAVHSVSYYETDIKCLQNLCDSWFNNLGGAEVEFSPVAPLVMANFISCPDLIYPEWDGSSAQMSLTELYFQFLVREKKGELYRFIPYRFVSNSAAIIPAARELFGIPTTDSELVMKVAPEPYSCSTQAIRVFSHNSQDKVWMIAKLEGDPHGTTKIPPKRGAENKAFEFLSEKLKRLKLKEDVLRMLASVTNGKFLNLKQLRVPASTNKAFYQAILYYENQATFSGFMPITEKVKLSFPIESDMYPVCQNLGLNAEGVSRQVLLNEQNRGNIPAKCSEALAAFRYQGSSSLISTGCLHEVRLNPNPDDLPSKVSAVPDVFDRFIAGNFDAYFTI